LEDPQIKSLLNEHPDNIFSLIGIKRNEDHVLFIDEIQYLDNPTNFLKYLYDTYKDSLKLVVSGSSSFYLDHKFRDSLIGRKRIFEILGLNFIEFLNFSDESELMQQINDKSIPLLNRKKINDYFQEYLKYGSYPEIVLIKDPKEKEQRLKEYAFDYVKKDLFEAKIQDETKFFHLIRILAEQTGNLINKNELATTLGLSSPTIEKFLYVLQKSYLINLVRPFYRNIRKELSKMPKVYFYDLGIRNAFLRNFSHLSDRVDRGEALENAVFREFAIKNHLEEIKYWRTKGNNEVDFIISEQQAFEVKYAENKISIKKYTNFKQSYPEIPLNFIHTENIFDTFYMQNK